MKQEMIRDLLNEVATGCTRQRDRTADRVVVEIDWSLARKASL